MKRTLTALGLIACFGVSGAVAQPANQDALIGDWSCGAAEQGFVFTATLDLQSGGVYDGDITLSGQDGENFLEVLIVHNGTWSAEGDTLTYVSQSMELTGFDASPALAPFEDQLRAQMQADTGREERFTIQNYTDTTMTLVDPAGAAFDCERV